MPGKKRYSITDAKLSKDSGKYYLVWQIRFTGYCNELSAPVYIDKPLIDNKDPLLREYLEIYLEKTEKYLSEMEKSKVFPPKYYEFKNQLTQLKNIKGKL